MYKIFFSLIVLIILLFTLCAGIFQPKMHKALVMYNHEYTVQEVEPDKNLSTTDNKPLSTTLNTKKVEKVEKVKKIENVEQVKVYKTNEPARKKTVEKPSNRIEKLLTNTVQQESEETEFATKQMTEEEKAQQEVILWNEWRSNLQNRIMQDVKLPIVPEGTIFKFSFNVDKYGKISNIQTWSLSPAYTPYAIQYIAPVIRSYQGHDILNFPQGSTRFSTLFEGGWKISKTAKFSTPDDYSDTEKILNRN